MNLTDYALLMPVIRMTRQLMTGDRAHAGHPFTPITSMQPMIMPGAGPAAPGGLPGPGRGGSVSQAGHEDSSPHGQVRR